MGMSRTMHSVICRDFASHGYIVFTIDHKDRSTLYTESADGKTCSYYDNSKKALDLNRSIS